MNFKGHDRRIHKVFVTRNTEYHVRAGTCVGVRDLRDGAWHHDHPAVGRRLAGTLRYVGNGGILPVNLAPEPGDSIYFRRGERDLITSKLVSVERPSREVVAGYPTLS